MKIYWFKLHSLHLVYRLNLYNYLSNEGVGSETIKKTQFKINGINNVILVTVNFSRCLRVRAFSL